VAAKSLIGHNWTLALGNQSIAGAYIEGATISGVSSGAGAVFVDCHFVTSQTIGSGDYYRCGFGVTTFTMLASSLYNFVACFDDDPDTATSPIFVFAASAVVGARNWRGAFQVSSMASTNKLTLDGAGRLIITDTSEGGAITVRGFYPPIAGGAGLHTVAEFQAHGGTFTQTTRYDTDQINAEVVDVLRTDTIPDSYAAHEAQPTISQAVLEILQFLTEKSVTSTTVTVNKPDGSTAVMAFTLDSATAPTSITRKTNP
jgi:hypothetical protein